MIYASNKVAKGICDRCGFTYMLKELREEVSNGVSTNLYTCPTCWDPDHPQNELRNIRAIDSQTLYNPRPDTGEAQSREMFSWNPIGGIFIDVIVGSVTIGPS